MKVITLLGSPHKNGNTAKALGRVEEGLRAKNAEISRVFIPELSISPCNGCYKCQRDETRVLTCAIEDDALTVFKQMIDSDLIIYAAPVYFWGFPALFKGFIDRHLCTARNYIDPSKHFSFLDGKKVAFLTTAGGPIKNNADTLIDTFRSISKFSKTQVIGTLGIPGCLPTEGIKPEFESEVLKFTEKLSNYFS